MSPVSEYARCTSTDLVMKPNGIQGIGRCCTRGFAWVEVVATVGQQADCGAQDYSAQHGLAQTVKNCALYASVM